MIQPETIICDGQPIDRRTFYRDWARYQLKTTIGHESFRGFQEEAIIDSLMGHDVLAVMRTGGGKSLLYQIPALLPQLMPGLIVVISPLLALQRDQVAECEGIGTATDGWPMVHSQMLNSEMSKPEQMSVIDKLRMYSDPDAEPHKLIRVLFLGPERIKDRELWQLLAPIVALFVIDEAHCISQWGHDFRPAFRRMKGLIQDLKGNPRYSAPIVMLTATATPATVQNITWTLGLDPRDVRQYISSPIGEHISLNVHRLGYPPMMANRIKDNWILENVANREEQTIVYCGTQARVNEILDPDKSPLARRLEHRLVGFHGDSPEKQKQAASEAMKSGEALIGVFTCAAGLGVNWKHVRSVVHTDAPGRLEAMVQEAGRAGRDGRAGSHHLLSTDGDWWLAQKQLEGNNPPLAAFVAFWRWALSLDSTSVLLSQSKIAKEAEVDPFQIQTIFSVLKEMELIETQKQTIGERSKKMAHWATKWLHIQRPDIDLDQFRSLFSVQVMKEKLDRELKGLEAMQRYANNPMGYCRTNMILAYFGILKHAKDGQACGNCDSCISKEIPF